MPDGSVSFDRAAGYYDSTRVLPPETHRAAIATLAGELRGRGRCLEIGVGTGRLAVPLAADGIDIYGVDIAKSMLDKLLEKSAAVRVAAADATRLPFPAAVFGGAYGVHVLHLMESWADAVHELVRVVRPGGVLVFDIGSADRSRPGAWSGIAQEIEDRFMDEAGMVRRHPGITKIVDLDRILAKAGAAARDLDPIHGFLELAPAVILQLLEQGIFSFTWGLDPAARSRTAASVRSWAAERFGDLDRPQRIETIVAFRAYDLAR